MGIVNNSIPRLKTIPLPTMSVMDLGVYAQLPTVPMSVMSVMSVMKERDHERTERLHYHRLPAGGHPGEPIFPLDR